MRPAYKQHVREFVKGGRAALANHSLDEGLRLKDTRNRPSVDPNCELFPQGPIIPVPPNTPPYRPVGACGNNRAVSPGRHAKRKPTNQRVRRPLFPLFRWWLCPESMPKQHQTVLGSTKTRVQKPVSAIPTRWLKTASSLFQLHPVSKIAEKPWGQIWVTVFRAIRAVFLGHAWPRQTASSNLWGTWTLYSKGGQGREAPTNTLLAATMDPRSSTCTARSEALSSQCPLPQKRFSAFRFSHKLSFRD